MVFAETTAARMVTVTREDEGDGETPFTGIRLDRQLTYYGYEQRRKPQDINQSK
jgi:hypothetical protein